METYKITDKAIALLNKKAVRRFETARRKCNLLHFDELNVIKTITALYSDLASDNEKTLLELAQMVYGRTDPHGSSKPTKKWLEELLEDDDPVTLYVYLNEITRKRDYAIEGITAASDKRKEFQRALRYWTRMTAHEADRVTDKAVLKAFKDAGVKKVRWNSEKDDKVCEHCRPMDGKIFDIDKAPAKKHMNCRCYYTAVIEK